MKSYNYLSLTRAFYIRPYTSTSHDVSSLITKTNFNAKFTEIEGKTPDVTSLVTKTYFNAKFTEIEGKIPDFTSLVRKTHFDAKLKKKIVTELPQVNPNICLLKIN